VYDLRGIEHAEDKIHCGGGRHGGGGEFHAGERPGLRGERQKMRGR